MQCSLVVRVRTEWLGDRRISQPTMRVFPRLKTPKENPDIRLDAELWSWTLGQAQADLRMREVTLSTLHFPLGFRAPSLHRFVRRWRNPGGQGFKTETFEGIRAGTILRMDFMVSDPNPRDRNAAELRAPYPTELYDLFAHVGLYYGLSPFGGQFNLGRFDVVECAGIKHQIEESESEDEQKPAEVDG